MNRYQQGIDRWVRRTCTLSIRNGSFFENSKLPLYKLIELIYYWADCTPQKTVQREIEVTQYHTTIDWYNFCSDVRGQHLLQNRQQIGGLELDDNGNIVPKVVEIVESKFFHRKYHRGEYKAVVERRDGATLLQ